MLASVPKFPSSVVREEAACSPRLNIWHVANTDCLFLRRLDIALHRHKAVVRFFRRTGKWTTIACQA